MTKLLLVVAALLALQLHGAIPTAASETSFNKLPGTPLARKYALGTQIREAHNTLVCVYDFTKRGGAVSTINLKQTDGLTDCSLPTKAIVRGGVIDVITAPTSGGSATIAVGANTTVDLKAALAIASFTGQLATIPLGTAATAVKLTAARTITMTIATAALTAGKFRVFLDYVQSE